MRQKAFYLFLLLVPCLALLQSCKCEKSDGVTGGGFDPSQPIVVEDFYPDSGGVASPIIIQGKNFGTDTTGLRVYFRDSVGKSVAGGLVSTNGRQIYAYVPAGLTYKRNIDIVVARKASWDATDSIIGEASKQYIYRTQMAVTTVVGQQSTDRQPTLAGELLSCKLSSPFNLCLDNMDNIFVTERGSTKPGWSAHQPLNDKSGGVGGAIVMVSLSSNNVAPLKFDGGPLNAPAFSDEAGKEAVYVPHDAGLGFYQMLQSAGYVPVSLRVLATNTDDNTALTNGNWKHCFVVNKKDHYIYTCFWKGQLVRIDPRTRQAEILLDKIGTASDGSDAYITFSPLQGRENELYICLTDQNQIWRIPDVSALTPDQRTTYHGEPFAGKALTDGKQAGRGWEDGLLKNAKFNAPFQITFTSDGKLYIADAGNSCIRMIDTDPSIPDDKKTVTTVIGLPNSPGYKDGGPDIAKFNHPTGVAVSSDGRIVYVADVRNNVVRKLSIQ